MTNLFSNFFSSILNSYNLDNLEKNVSILNRVDIDGDSAIYYSNVVGDISKEEFDGYVKSIRLGWNFIGALEKNNVSELKFYLNGDLVYDFVYDSHEGKFMPKCAEETADVNSCVECFETVDESQEKTDEQSAEIDEQNSNKTPYVSPEIESHKSYAEFLKSFIEDNAKNKDDSLDRFTPEDLLHGLIEEVRRNNYETVLSKNKKEILGIEILASGILEDFDVLSDDAEWLVSEKGVLDKFFEECIDTLGFRSVKSSLEILDKLVNAKDIKFTLLF